MRPARRAAIAAILGFAFLGSSHVAALGDRKRRGRDKDDDDRDDHAAAARARAAGEILPLTDILEHVKATYPGDVVGIELDREDGRWVYEIKLITPESRYLEIYVDARDKSIVKIEGK